MNNKIMCLIIASIFSLLTASENFFYNRRDTIIVDENNNKTVYKLIGITDEKPPSSAIRCGSYLTFESHTYMYCNCCGSKTQSRTYYLDVYTLREKQFAPLKEIKKIHFPKNFNYNNLKYYYNAYKYYHSRYCGYCEEPHKKVWFYLQKHTNSRESKDFLFFQFPKNEAKRIIDDFCTTSYTPSIAMIMGLMALMYYYHFYSNAIALLGYEP